jgi:hypothetical protein
MNPALSFMPKFFVIGGLILVLSGVAQWWVRRRNDEQETLAQLLGSRATLKMIVFVSVGIFFTLLGAGAIPFPHFR